MAVDKLPNDIEALKTLLLNANKENRSLQKKIDSLHTLITIYETERRLAAARQFAPSSEKQQQLALFDEAERGADTPEETEIEPTTSEVQAHQRRGGRNTLPANLPRVEIIHDLTDAEKRCTCGCIKEHISEDILEQLDIIPAMVRVLKHIRLKYVCKYCESTRKQPHFHRSPYPKVRSVRGFWRM